MDVAQAAVELNVSEERVRKLCQQGRFGRKIAGVWIITRSELDEYKRGRRGPGRPRESADPDDGRR